MTLGRPETWHAIFELLDRSYFRRVWIFQEVQLATVASIQCSNETTSWRYLRRAIIACSVMTLLSGVPAQLRSRLDTLWSLVLDSRSLDPVRLFDYVIAAECSNPRDRVFGILGPLPPVLSRKIQPDYTQPTQEVQRDAILACIEATGALFVFGLVRPLWIPDWNAPKMLFLNVLNGSCTGETDAEALFIAFDVLQVKGVLYDTIDEVRQLLSFDDDQVLATFKEFWLSGSQSYPSGGTLVNACAWMLWLGDLTEKRLMSDSSSLADVQLHLKTLKDHDVCSSDVLPTAGNI
jgi:hypothetical protein